MYKKEELVEKTPNILNKNSSLSFFDICKEMKISRGTAYKYFKDKEDLRREICIYMKEKGKISKDESVTWILYSLGGLYILLTMQGGMEYIVPHSFKKKYTGVL